MSDGNTTALSMATGYATRSCHRNHEVFTIRRKQAQQADADGESTDLSEDGWQWVWVSLVPQYRLTLTALVSSCTFDSVLRLIQMTAAVVLDVPRFFSDGFSCYLSALMEVYHTLKTFPRMGKPGRPKKPAKAPQLDLVYGQEIKKKRQGRLQELVYRVCCSAKARIPFVKWFGDYVPSTTIS